MTFIGHSLAGLSIGILGLPQRTGTKWKVLYFLLMIFLSNIPDFRIPGWGHDRYDISHSLFVNLLLILILLPWGLLLFMRRITKESAVLFTVASAWLSHLMLDSFYNHGFGVAVFWPFFQKSLAMPLPWFSILPDKISLQSLKVYTVEFIFYGFIMSLCVWVRRKIQDKKRP